MPAKSVMHMRSKILDSTLRIQLGEELFLNKANNNEDLFCGLWYNLGEILSKISSWNKSFHLITLLLH